MNVQLTAHNEIKSFSPTESLTFHAFLNKRPQRTSRSTAAAALLLRGLTTNMPFEKCNAKENTKLQTEADDEGTIFSSPYEDFNPSNQSCSKACVGGQGEERVTLFIVHRHRDCSRSQAGKVTSVRERKSERKWLGKDNCRICILQKRIPFMQDATSSMEKVFHPWSWMTQLLWNSHLPMFVLCGSVTRWFAVLIIRALSAQVRTLPAFIYLDLCHL